jgi:hypothetical protein
MKSVCYSYIQIAHGFNGFDGWVRINSCPGFDLEIGGKFSYVCGMKNKIKSFIFALLIFPMFGYADLFAQKNWTLVGMNIQVPAIVSLVVGGDCPSEYTDSNRTFAYEVGIGSYGATITFSLDSIHRKLNNVIVSSSYGQGGSGSIIDGVKTTSFQISSLYYVISSDSIVEINTNGAALKSSLLNVSFNIAGWPFICSNRGHWGEEVILDSLLNDTSQYMCSITFNIPQPVSAVNESSPNNISLVASTIFLEHKVHLSFHSSDQSQILSFYDLLGREIQHIEIPAGMSEYQIPSSRFLAGCYIARLGNMTAKFIVEN